MLYHIFKLMDDTDLAATVSELMKSSDWVDGSKSALGRAKEIKRNIQLNPGSNAYKIVSSKVCELLMAKISTIEHHIQPKKIIDVLFSRTSNGMYYGTHVDRSLTADGRRDYSFTLFLSNPSDYDGGELVLNIPPERKSIKLEAGSIIIYPTKYLHEVRQVTNGERIACVGWIESLIKNDDEREMLAHIMMAMMSVKNNDRNNSITYLNLAYERLRKYFGG